MLRLALLAALLCSALSNPLPLTTKSEGSTPRHLEEADYSWMTGYTLKYENCFADKGLVSFRLCPRDNSCRSGCTEGGQYLVDFEYFVDAFTEAQMGAREYACEMVRENCQYDDEDFCYQNAGMSYCMDDDDDEFDVQEYLECQQYGDDLYMGPYCSSDDAYSVYLGMFTDEYCTEPTDDSAFYDIEGYVLPYSKTSEHSIIENECADCREHGDQDQADGDQSDQDDVLEQCEELYAASSKCEEDLDVSYPDTSSCEYLEQVYEEEDAIKSSSMWTGWTIFFALSIAALSFGICGYCMVQRMNKKEVETTGPSNANLI